MQETTNDRDREEPRYSVAEAAKLLGLSTPTAYRYIRQRILPCHLVGKRRVLSDSDLEEYRRGRRL